VLKQVQHDGGFMYTEGTESTEGLECGVSGRRDGCDPDFLGVGAEINSA
jgi:hypothetical protein